MIFLTVGTLFPFDRLVKTVDTAIENDLINEEVFAQISKGGYRPKNMKYTEVLDKSEFDKYIENAVGLISHAGIGSITMALNHNKPMLVMPRLKKFKEHVNDHQVGTAKKFEKLGHVLAMYDENDLPQKIKQLHTFTPVKRISQEETVVNRIQNFINELL